MTHDVAALHVIEEELAIPAALPAEIHRAHLRAGLLRATSLAGKRAGAEVVDVQ